jgi:hypothetical protein
MVRSAEELRQLVGEEERRRPEGAILALKDKPPRLAGEAAPLPKAPPPAL